MSNGDIVSSRKGFSSDEIEIIEGCRMVKRHRKGHLQVSLKSDGTQFYMEITPAKEGKVEASKEST